MAQDPLAMVYGGQIGQGQAQVFDTSGLAKQVVLQQKEKDKAFLDSIIDLDTSKVWNQDLPEYNKMWDKYRNYVSENYKALSNPSRNVDIWSEKKRMEQEMLNFVSTSHSQAKGHAEFTKSLRDVNTDGNLKWNQSIDENEFLPNGDNNPNYGRALSDLYKEMSLSDRSSINIWDLKTAVQKDIGNKQIQRNKSLYESTIEHVTDERFIDNDPQKGKHKIGENIVDMAAWDQGIASWYDNNPNYAAQINAQFEKYKEEHRDENGDLYMDFLVKDENGVEKMESILVDNGRTYDIVKSRANLPKGSYKSTYTNPTTFNMETHVSVNTEQQEEYAKGTVELQTSGANFDMLGGEFNFVPVTYSGGAGSSTMVSFSPQGTVKSNSGNNYTNQAISGRIIGYTEQGGEYGMLIQRDSKFAKDKETELKAELKDLNSQNNIGYKYAKATEDDLANATRNGKKINASVGDVIDNPRIKELEGEIAGLGATDVDETIWILLKDKYNINIAQKLTQDSEMEYADVVKLFGGSNTKKKNNANNYNLN